MYKVDQGLLPDQFSSNFTLSSNIHDHNARAKDNIHIYSHRTKVKAQNISMYCAKVWNAIPICITRSISISQFKSCLKKTDRDSCLLNFTEICK